MPGEDHFFLFNIIFVTLKLLTIKLLHMYV